MIFKGSFNVRRALQTSTWEDQEKDETDEELTHSINLIRKPKENIPLRNNGIYKTAWKKPTEKDEPLQNPQGACTCKLNFDAFLKREV